MILKTILSRNLASIIPYMDNKMVFAIRTDLAMTKGVNYPKGLISWGKEIGLDVIVERLN